MTKRPLALFPNILESLRIQHTQVVEPRELYKGHPLPISTKSTTKKLNSLLWPPGIPWKPLFEKGNHLPNLHYTSTIPPSANGPSGQHWFPSQLPPVGQVTWAPTEQAKRVALGGTYKGCKHKVKTWKGIITSCSHDSSTLITWLEQG